MPNNVQFRINYRYVLTGLALLLALYVILPQIGEFRSSWKLLSHPKLSWVLVAIVYTALTYFSAAATYKFLAFTEIKFKTTLLVQVAAMFVNRLLPAGIGALGANFSFLKKHKHTTEQAGAVVAVNNFLGLAGHNILLFGVIFISGLSTSQLGTTYQTANLLKIFVAISILVAIFALIFGRMRLQKALKNLFSQLVSYRQRPVSLALALATSMSLTLLNVLSLQACALAIGINLSLAQLFIIFTYGIGAATITPTPGGLGGFEAALAAGFVSFGIATPAALAAALLYRLISYWLALIAGSVAFLVTQKLKLI